MIQEQISTDEAATQAVILLRDTDPEELKRKLHRHLDPSHGVALQIVSERGLTTVRAPSVDFDSDTPVSIGCVAKLMTGALAAIAVKEEHISWSDPVSQYLTKEQGSPLFEHLRQVAIHQILTHSHGLDATHIPKIYRTESGYLDARPLLFTPASAQIIARPGETVNYGSVGSWLMAVVLERLYSRPYRQLVEAKLLQPHGIGKHPETTDPCPATGTGLLLSASSLSKLSRLFIPSIPDPLSPLPDISQLYNAHTVPLPPRPYVGKNMCLGLIDYGGGWFGHSGRSPSASVVFRVSPDEQTSLIITANEPRLSHAVMGGLFGSHMIDMRAVRPPKQLLPAQANLVRTESYCGIYRNGKYTLKVTAGDSGELCAEVLDTPAGVIDKGPVLVSRRIMRPAADNCFLSTVPEPLILGMIYFHGEGPNGEQTFARTATQLFARVPD